GEKNRGIWGQGGDLAAVAERSWIELIAGTNQLVAESARRRVGRLKEDLGGDSPTVIERVLIDHLAACYLAAQHAEIQAASPAGGPLEQASFRFNTAQPGQPPLPPPPH